MDYETTKDTAQKWGITNRMVLYYCTSGRISGAVKMGNTWLVPCAAEKPSDRRYKDEMEVTRLEAKNDPKE